MTADMRKNWDDSQKMSAAMPLSQQSEVNIRTNWETTLNLPPFI